MRHRFHANHDDWRPVIYNPQYPCWKTGESYEGDMAIVVAYLPKTEKLEDYWPEACCVDSTECEGPVFSGRFPKPKGYVDPVKKEYHIWTEGFQITGQSGDAKRHTVEPIPANSFDEAVELYVKAHPDFKLLLKHHEDGRWTWWGCQLFDNETDARKSFG